MKTTLIISALVISMLGPCFAFSAETGEIRTDSGIRQDISLNETKPLEAAKTEEEAKKAAEEAKKIVVARVNGVEINALMLVRAMNRIAPKYDKDGKAASAETTRKIRKEALDGLIFEELAVQEAVRQGISPTPEAIAKVIGQVKENLGTQQKYVEYLEKTGLTEDALRRLIERNQRFELITAREIYRKVRVDEKVVREEYEKEKDRYVLPEDFSVDDVFFLNSRDEAAAPGKVDKVLSTIRGNNNDPWKLVLDGTFIVRSTHINKVNNPEIYRAMINMGTGDLSGVIKDLDGLHIIKVRKKEPSRPLTFEEARKSIETKFLVPAQDEKKKTWEKELSEKAHIEIIPEEMTEKLGKR